MGRKAAGLWRIYERDGIAWIDTSLAGQRVRRSLDVAYAEPPSRAQRRAAEAAAEDFYRKLVAGRVVGPSERVLTPLRLEEAFGMFLDAIETPNNKPSIATRRTYGRSLLAWAESDLHKDSLTPFERVASDWGPQAFAQARLCAVLRKTTRKEVSTVMAFLTWCKARGFVSSVPPRPVLPPSEPGVRSGKQRVKPVHISPVEALSIVQALPEWSPGRLLKGERHGAFRVRAPNEFAWEMAMRPITVARLRVPENWRKGAAELELRDEDDKARYGRALKLSARARAILEECAPVEGGLIFGDHAYDDFLKAAALKTLPKEKALAFAAYDFRHGRAKALLRAGAPLKGVQYLLGHKLLTTTNVYVSDDGKLDGDEAIDLADAELDTILSPGTDAGPKSLVGARGFEPPTPRPPEQEDSENADDSGCQEASEDPPKPAAADRRPSQPTRFRHAALTDVARGLEIERAVWDAFDLWAAKAEVDE